MRTRRCVIAFIIITLQVSILGSASSQNSQRASEVVKEQLCGLRYVDLVVYVGSLDIKNSAVIQERIEKAAIRMLSKAGILLGKQQGAVLSIVIGTYPVDLKDHQIVQVWTKLREEASLKRAPNLGNPYDFITWDSVWVELVRGDDVDKFALKEAKDQLDDFCLDWETARDLAKKRLPPDIITPKPLGSQPLFSAPKLLNERWKPVQR